VKPFTDLAAILEIGVMSRTAGLNKKACAPDARVEEWSSPNNGRMNMNIEIRELNVAELEGVAGGKCGDTQTAAINVDNTTAIVLAALGDLSGARFFSGKAEGRVSAVCSGPA
jgi:hypothetical protein